ncbi:MAG: PKD domain-containing protein, partial [Promethearchaeota archaeon]
PADVIKILANDWIDRNGNSVMDTSNDTNNDGTISPSEMFPMTDSNINGKIDDNEINDERVAWAASVGASNGLGRSLAIDINGNIWLGLFNTRQYYKLNSSDGSILAGPISVSPHTPYGALVDQYGILWGASLGSNLLKFNITDHTYTTYYHYSYGSNYGIALGYDSNNDTHVYLASSGGNTYIEFDSSTNTFSIPAAMKFPVLGVATDSQGNIIASQWTGSGLPGVGGVAKFKPDGSLIWWKPPQVTSEARGTVVDSNDDVWIIHRDAHKLSKFNASNGASLGTFNTGRYPYTYSDATGLGLRSAIRGFGTWTVNFDSELVNAPWGTVSWNSNEPTGTSVTVRVRSSSDESTWSSWETTSNGVALSSTPNGQYLQIETTLRITSGDVSPILYDLTVQIGNRPPVADAGADQTHEQTSHAGASVTLDGSGSYDPDFDPLTYSWTWTGGSATGVNPTATFPLGSTVVTLTVFDGIYTDTDTVLMTVIDTTPPSITTLGNSIVLWPPNHKYHTITVSDFIVSVTDICDADVGIEDIVITSVSSDEPENVKGNGDGNTMNDIVIVDSQTVKLRAERQGKGNGRVYTINFEVTDGSANTATGSFQVWVPHDKKPGSIAIDDGPAYTVTAP